MSRCDAQQQLCVNEIKPGVNPQFKYATYLNTGVVDVRES